MAQSNDPRRNRRVCLNAGDLAPLVKEFTHYLSNRGHARRTVRGYEWLTRQLVQWIHLSNVAVADIDDAVAERFVCDRYWCTGQRCVQRVRYLAQVRRFIEFLRERNIVRSKSKVTPPALDRRVLKFQDWLRQHRGIRELTINRHGRMIKRLLPTLGHNPRNWDAKLIREAIIAERKRASIATMKQMITALRGYLKFLGARRLCRAGLDQAVPCIPQWRLSTLPRFIGAEDVERLIATCDQATPTGLRDRAILMLLARLGLRAGDIVSLRLTDVDWQQATLLVCGKGRRNTRLPLPQDAGDAVLAYLRKARPRVADDRIFLISNAPIRPFTGSNAVSQIVRRALTKAGIAAPSKGANLLRHSAATAMLRGGATIDTVGAVLRHRSPSATAHYAKVDVVMLQQIAQPWPGDAS
jgi:integrase/recombinase XerD